MKLAALSALIAASPLAYSQYETPDSAPPAPQASQAREACARIPSEPFQAYFSAHETASRALND